MWPPFFQLCALWLCAACVSALCFTLSAMEIHRTISQLLRKKKKTTTSNEPFYAGDKCWCKTLDVEMIFFSMIRNDFLEFLLSVVVEKRNPTLLLSKGKDLLFNSWNKRFSLYRTIGTINKVKKYASYGGIVNVLKGWIAATATFVCVTVVGVSMSNQKSTKAPL